MSLFSTLFKEDTTAKLVFPSDFEASYIIETQNQLTLEDKDDPFELSVRSEFTIKQCVNARNIISHIHLLNISGKAEDEAMQPRLEQILALFKIAPETELRRNLKGSITGVENPEQLRICWEQWKKDKIHEVFPEKDEQEQFIKNHEKEFFDFESGINNNTLYLLLMPECFHYKIYMSAHGEDRNSMLQYESQFIDDCTILYSLEKTKIESLDPVRFTQESTIENRDTLRRCLKDFYEDDDLTDADINDYKFSLQTKYEMLKNSGEIQTGILKLTEELHENLKYEIIITMNKK